MENTVEAILAHGEQAPALLVQTLRQTKTAPTSSHAGAATTQTPNREAQDSMLAQQLAAEERHQQAAQQQQQQQQQLQQSQKRPAGRGLPTDLPSDFLRIPGYTVSASSTTSSIMDQDEALARMLQDELFSQELANNPEFAHLVNGRAGAGSRNQRTTPVPRGSHMQYPSRTNTAATTTNAATGPPIMDHIAGRSCRGVFIVLDFVYCMSCSKLCIGWATGRCSRMLWISNSAWSYLRAIFVFASNIFVLLLKWHIISSFLLPITCPSPPLPSLNDQNWDKMPRNDCNYLLHNGIMVSIKLRVDLRETHRRQLLAPQAAALLRIQPSPMKHEDC